MKFLTVKNILIVLACIAIFAAGYWAHSKYILKKAEEKSASMGPASNVSVTLTPAKV